MSEMETVSKASEAAAEENSVKKMSARFLFGICGWIWWEGAGSRGKWR